MRADRLISIVMLLQTQEKLTADELSKFLEVSPRTIYRDITALNIAGIPIYTDRGPGGGISLIESYRTSLTGMNEDELRALFMISIPDALVQLGFEHRLKSALLKLAASLPANQQQLQTLTQQRFYIDSTPWRETDEQVPHIGVIQQAVWQDKLLRLTYQGRFNTRLEIDLLPMGLVAKMDAWYLVGKYDRHMRVIKVADILQVEIIDQTCERDEDFDLAGFWKAWCKAAQDRRPVLEVQIMAAPKLLDQLSYYLGEGVKFDIPDNEGDQGEGWKRVRIQFENMFQAREKILGMGSAAEVLEPEALRLSVIDFAKQIVNHYGRSG